MKTKEVKKEKYKNSFLIPTKEEQTVLKLKGKCLHNEDWNYIARYGDDILYRCSLCSEGKMF